MMNPGVKAQTERVPKARNPVPSRYSPAMVHRAHRCCPRRIPPELLASWDEDATKQEGRLSEDE